MCQNCRAFICSVPSQGLNNPWPTTKNMPVEMWSFAENQCPAKTVIHSDANYDPANQSVKPEKSSFPTGLSFSFSRNIFGGWISSRRSFFRVSLQTWLHWGTQDPVKQSLQQSNSLACLWNVAFCASWNEKPKNSNISEFSKPIVFFGSMEPWRSIPGKQRKKVLV